MALSITLYPDSGDLAEISINKCSIIYTIYPIERVWKNADFRVSIRQNMCSGPWDISNDVLECAKINTATDLAVPNLGYSAMDNAIAHTIYITSERHM